MHRNGCLERRGGAGRGGNTSPPSLEAVGEENLCAEPPARSLPASPAPVVAYPRQRWPRPREVAGCLRLGTAGGAQSSCLGGRDTVTCAKDRPWHRTQTRLLRVYPQAPAGVCAHTSRLPRAQLPRPGPAACQAPDPPPGLDREGPQRRL